MTKEIVLASRNAKKLAELQALLDGLGLRLRLLSDFCDDAADETAPSFVENALLKARHAAKASGLAAIADDSGLEVDALNGAPGVQSARYAGMHGDDQANNAKLVQALHDLPDAQRGARFVCALAFLRNKDDPVPITVRGVWRGRILTAPRGSNGFGYDPLFYVADYDKTSAELDAALKNRISHRARAAAALLAQLRESGVGSRGSV
jgi:XTP/dITP diphosphohydrolase